MLHCFIDRGPTVLKKKSDRSQGAGSQSVSARHAVKKPSHKRATVNNVVNQRVQTTMGANRMGIDVNRLGNRRASSLARTRASTGNSSAKLHPSKKSRALAQVLQVRRIQRKASVSSPQDSSEREARAAGAAMANAPCAACAAGAPCGRCEPQTAHLPRVINQAQPARDGSTQDALGTGQALSEPLQSFFAPQIGQNLSAVRIHTSDEADSAARALNAEAFTIGPDIAFRRGRFAPETNTGRILLGHELTHVAQQAKGTNQARIQRDDPPGSAGDRIQAPAEPEEVEDTRSRTRAEWFYFRSYRVADDADFMRGELRRLITSLGIARADAWMEALIGSGGRRERSSGLVLPFSAHTSRYHRPVQNPHTFMQRERAENTNVRIAVNAIPTTTRVYREVRKEATEYLTLFEGRAKDITMALLAESRARADAERIRYGLRRIEVSGPDWSTDDNGQPERPYSTYRHEMSGNLSNQGLSGAAKDLKAKLDEVHALDERRRRLMIYSHGYVGPSNPTQYEALGVQREERYREFSIIRSVYQERYPILASLATDTSALATLSEGPGAGMAQALNQRIYGTLDDIATVEQELRGGSRVQVWKLEDIVYLTKQATGAQAQTTLGRMRNKIVDDKKQQIEADETFRNTLIAVLAIGLALIAAIPSGGSSLVAAGTALAGIASLGVSIQQAGEHFQEYQIQEAMSGTDFDRARAISTEDPSMFWLAIDILGAALDVGPALRGTRLLLTTGRTTFRRLAPLARRAMGTGRSASDALVELRRAAGDAGGSGLAARLVRSVERLRGAGSVERVLGRAAGHEGRAVARGVRALEQGAAEAISSLPTRLGGHTVSVAPNGWIIRCSVCGQLREEFAMELARSPGHARRVFAVEDLGRRAAAARAADNLTEARRLGDRAAEQARALSDELEGVRRTREIRMFRGVRPQAIDDVLLMDSRLVMDMPFVGTGAARSARNAAGWMSDKNLYWQEMLRRHPDAFDASNRVRLAGTGTDMTGPMSPVNNPTFRRYFPQYDIRGWHNKKLIHHHIGGGGQAVAVPLPLHQGSGGIHNFEGDAAITGAENELAGMLQRLLDRTPP